MAIVIRELLGAGLLDSRELVEQGVVVTSDLVLVAGQARWALTSHPMTGTGGADSLERELAAYRLGADFPTLRQIMPELFRLCGNTLLVAPPTENPVWHASASIAVATLARVHRDTRGAAEVSQPTLPWILSCMDADAPGRLWDVARDSLSKIGGRTRTVLALRHLRSEWRSESFIHGTASLYNVKCVEGRLQFVKWGASGWGDPAWDIASLCRRGVLMHCQRGSPVATRWAEIAPEISTCMALHASIYGYHVEPRRITGLIGASIIQSTITTLIERGEMPETEIYLGIGSELLENLESFASALSPDEQAGQP